MRGFCNHVRHLGAASNGQKCVEMPMTCGRDAQDARPLGTLDPAMRRPRIEQRGAERAA
jgi:hypothetical protein